MVFRWIMTESSKKKKLGPAIALYLLGLLLVAGAALLLYKLMKNQTSRVFTEVEARESTARAGPRVLVAAVKRAPAQRTITLIGEADPFITATLYAKVSGYLKEIKVDKGDHVEENQILAVIESPETDHQYQAAVADARNKAINAQRAATLVKRQMISQQDADNAEADAKVAEANVATLATLKSYEIIHAPFTGTITARYADPGALLQNATGSQTSSLPLVTVAQTGLLRVYVYPDQADAVFVHPGTPAEIAMPERPDRKLPARVTRMSGQLDPKTRTMLTEIDFNNSRGEILPGSFVQVSLQLHTPSYLEVPSDALEVRGGKAFVALVGPRNQIHFQPVVVASDDGTSARLASGVQPGDRIAINLGDSAGEGGTVQPVEGQ